ncbi:MAG: rubrerythrin family protein [Haloplasmataceae bacterium]|jgi:rubrerythrin|nr:rubrerythrin family protein [Haloplasmataceae bacterium]
MKAEVREKFASYAQGKSLKGTETEKNILKSFAGESQAYNRYVMFAEVARLEGYQQIAGIFEETAHNEQLHAQTFFAFLQGDMVEITAAFPAGKIGLTHDNLIASAEGEHEEFAELYPHFAEVADQEGFPKIANQFRLIAKVEKEHEERYRKLADNVAKDKVFAKDEKFVWVCRECGHIHVGIKAPAMCPTCLVPQEYFEIKANNY